MRRPTCLLLAGIVISGSTLGIGTLVANHLAHVADRDGFAAAALHAKYSECLHRDIAQARDNPAAALDALMKNKDQCPDDTKAADATASMDEERAGLARRWTLRASIAAIVILGLPWLWHFSLRRIAEVGAAFRGTHRS